MSETQMRRFENPLVSEPVSQAVMKGSSKDAITSKKPSELKLKKDDIDWLLALGFDYLIVKKGSFLIRTVRGAIK